VAAFLFLVGPTALILFGLRVIPAYRRLHPVVRILAVGPVIGPAVTFVIIHQIATDALHYFPVFPMFFGGMLIASAVEAVVWWIPKIVQLRRRPHSN
jgi:hypothetical protein